MTDSVGAGSLRGLADIVTRSDASNILVFTGGSSYQSSGAADVVEPIIAGKTTTRIANVEANPTIDAVRSGCDIVRQARPDLIIAIGGGSVIDLAKSVRALAPQSADPREIVLAGGEGIDHRGVTLVAVPTTSGTGSEVTHFAVVYVDGKKYSLTHEWVRPDHAIVDPTLTYTLPPAITAATGLDALSQAVESFWSNRSTPESTRFADEAMRLAYGNLADAVHRPDPESRLAMSKAAHLAGRAIDITTTTAPHALSYTLTSGFGVPHGNAVAITLGAVLEYNADVEQDDCTDPRGVSHVTDRIATIVAMLGADSPSDARARLEQLVNTVGLPSNLSEVGAGSTTARQKIASSVNPERLSGNPRAFTEARLQTLVDSLG